MLERYGKQSLASLSSELNRSRFSVAQKARRLFLCDGQPQKKAAVERAKNSISVNANYFEQVDSDVAFTAGFIFGCGSLKTSHRKVLKLRVEQSRRSTLEMVLSKIGSTHTIQEQGDFNIVEVCNSHLVGTLVSNWGLPPSRTNLDSAIRKLPVQIMSGFARGHVAGSGLANSRIVRWTGSPLVIESISGFLTNRLRITNPIQNKSGSKLHAAWKSSSDVAEILAFLGIRLYP